MGTDIHGIWQKKVEGGWIDVESNWDQGRHYLLFAWLGGVRNGHGFAGCPPTHSPIVPLAEGRGIPEDFKMEPDDIHLLTDPNHRDPRRRKYCEKDNLEFSMGDHSFSWISVDEVLAADPPKIWRVGIVAVEEFRNWDGSTAPVTYCGGISGPGIKVDDPESVDEKTTHVNVRWKEDAAESLKYFVDECRRLKELHGEVRLVFGFDS